MTSRHPHRAILAVTFAAGLVFGCVASGPPLTAQSPPPASRSLGNRGAPLVLDRTDLRIGTTVHFERVPTASELHDLQQLLGLAHVVLDLPAWPSSYAELQPLDQAPDGADVIVLLPGYPPTREAIAAWNLVTARLRLVLVVDGPPLSRTVTDDLNTMRGLERVIAQMDMPSRSGFERLQRPLSFRKVVE